MYMMSRCWPAGNQDALILGNYSYKYYYIMVMHIGEWESYLY